VVDRETVPVAVGYTFGAASVAYSDDIGFPLED